MSKSIYSLLNHADNNLSNYDEATISEFEIKKMKKNWRGAKRKDRDYYKLTKASCMAVIGIITIIAVFHEQVSATVRNMAYEINFLIDKNIDEYKTGYNINKKDKGYTITLNEVILDRDELIVSTTVSSKEKITAEQLSIYGDVTITGKGIDSESGGYGQNYERVDDYTFHIVTDFDMKDLNDINQKLLINFKITEIDFPFSTYDETVKGNWDFKFKADGTKLAEATKSIPLDQVITFPDGQQIRFTEYVTNDLSEKLYYELLTDEITEKYKCYGLRYDVLLEGEDNLGNIVQYHLGFENIVQYYTALGDQDGGRFLSVEPSKRAAGDAEEVYLNVYAERYDSIDEYIANYNDNAEESANMGEGNSKEYTLQEETSVTVDMEEPDSEAAPDKIPAGMKKVGEFCVRIR